MTTVVRVFGDYRVKYDEKSVSKGRWRNVEVAFTIDRPKVWGMEEENFIKELDEIFRRFISETTFTTFPEVCLGGSFRETEESLVEANTYKLEIEYSDYDYDKHFDRVILMKDVQKLWDTKEHKLFWDELSRQIGDIVTDEFMWGKGRPKGISTGGRP
jgi:hypothetical protein